MSKRFFVLPKQCLKITNEAVDISLSGGFMNDVFVVVVTKTATELFVVHFRFILTDSPPTSDL